MASIFVTPAYLSPPSLRPLLLCTQTDSSLAVNPLEPVSSGPSPCSPPAALSGFQRAEAQCAGKQRAENAGAASAET